MYVSVTDKNPDLTGIRRNQARFLFTFEPGHEKMCLMSYANNKGADPRSLISAFVFAAQIRSIISLDSIAEISRL